MGKKITDEGTYPWRAEGRAGGVRRTPAISPMRWVKIYLFNFNIYIKDARKLVSLFRETDKQTDKQTDKRKDRQTYKGTENFLFPKIFELFFL